MRRRGHPRHDQDLTQDFFVYLIEHRTLGRVDPDRGKFRNFLLAALKNFLNDRRDHLATQRRGGDLRFVPFGAGNDPEERYQLEAVGALMGADAFYESQWATALVETALDRLHAALTSHGKGAFFEQLKPFLAGVGDPMSYHLSAAGLGLSIGTLRTMVHHLRRQYRELLREEVARTVADSGEVDGELRHLCAVLAGQPG